MEYFTQCLKITKKSHFTTSRAKRAMFTFKKWIFAPKIYIKNILNFFFGKWDILRYFQTQCFMRRIIFSKNLFLRVCSLLSTKLQTLSNWKSAHAFCKVCLHIILRSLYFYPFTHLVKCHINNESWVDEKWNMVARMSIIFPFSKCSKFNQNVSIMRMTMVLLQLSLFSNSSFTSVGAF